MRSLRAKLIAPFIAGTLALTLLLAWYTYSSARKAVEDAMFLISEAKTSNASSSITLLCKTLYSSLQNMVVDQRVTRLFDAGDGVRVGSERTVEWLNTVIQGNEFYRDILILNADGICIVSSNPGHVGGYYGDKPYARDALNGMFNLGEATVGKVSKRFSVSMAGPVDVAGQVAGAVVIFGDFPKIVDYDAVTTHDAQVIFTALLAPDGLFVAHKDKAIMGNADRLYLDLYRQLSRVGEKGDTVEYSLDGKDYVGYARVESASKWVIVTSGERDQVFASAYRMGLVVLGISFAFLCCISLVVVRFANGILSSLLSLIGYAKHVSEGDFDLPLEDSTKTDELGTLHAALQRLVRALRSMLLETQEASKMKGQFLANMSHEIRTPLNAIIGMTHLSLKDGNLTGKQRAYLDNIQLAAKSLLGLINDILDISKVEAGMLELEHIPFNLRDTISNTLSIHQENAGSRGLSLAVEYDPDMPAHFIGDSLRISQVLNNLLSNALKFTREGGVTVRCRGEEEGNSGRVMARVSVTDTGIGMSPEMLDKLFQPFTQADASITRQFGGTGLGLAISDRLVHLLGGGFDVVSEEGRGTTFTFSMLLERDANALASSAEEVPLDQAFEQLKLDGKRILVAEDNAINQLIMAELIEPSGAGVVMADNGQQAVDAARDGNFDLVFMDMQMPVMDGLEATRVIRGFADKDNLPIIAVTANAMKEDRDKGFASGMNSYITKPIEPRQLLDILKLYLGPDKGAFSADAPEAGLPASGAGEGKA